MFLPQDADFRHPAAAAFTANTTSGTAVPLTAVDLTGYDYAIGIFQFGVIAASATCTALKVQVSDDDSTYTDVIDVVTPPTGQTGITFTDTSDFKFVQVAIDLRHRAKKYVRWSLTNGTTNSIGIQIASFVGIGGKQVPTDRANTVRLGQQFYA